MRKHLCIDILAYTKASGIPITSGELRRILGKGIDKSRFYRALADLVTARKIKRIGRQKSRHGGYVRG